MRVCELRLPESLKHLCSEGSPPCTDEGDGGGGDAGGLSSTLPVFYLEPTSNAKGRPPVLLAPHVLGPAKETENHPAGASERYSLHGDAWDAAGGAIIDENELWAGPGHPMFQ